jgi:hypothetical protein
MLDNRLYFLENGFGYVADCDRSRLFLALMRKHWMTAQEVHRITELGFEPWTNQNTQPVRLILEPILDSGT